MGRKRKKKNITLENIYHTYNYRHAERSKYYCTKTDYKKISLLFFKLLSKEIIDNGYVFKMPNRLGTIKVVKFKAAKKRSIDWKTTNELYGEYNKNNTDKKRVYFNNEHSEGYSVRYWWEASRWLKYNMLYRFKPTRANNRYLNKQIKDNNSIINYTEDLYQ